MRIILFLFTMVFFLSCYAAEDIYHFSSTEDQTRFAMLTSELRCLVCQNQNIAESNAPLAGDLRQQIFQQIQTGHSNQEIVDFLVDRYGNFILYRPPFNAGTIGLWFLPFILLFSGISYLVYYIRKKR